MSAFSWILGGLCIVLIVGLVAADDVPFKFNKIDMSINEYNTNQLERISNQTPELTGVPLINTSLNNEMGKNISIPFVSLPPEMSPFIVEDRYWLESGNIYWFRAGNIYYDERDYNKSIECYERAIQEDPQFAEAWYNKGTALCMLGKYEDAIKAFDKALESNPTYVKAEKNRETAYRAIRQQNKTY